MATNHNRPLSPHLQVYKLPLTGMISITHRLTGIFLSVGLIALVWILSGIAGGVESYQSMQETLTAWPIQIIYWGFLYALCFHLCHGIRHLIWDTGQTFEKASMDDFAVIELASSMLLFFGIMLFT